MVDFDVAVIGAGPAGAWLARFAPCTRLLVLCDDRPKPCGGLLSPATMRILASEGLAVPPEILTPPQIETVRVFDLESGLSRAYPRAYRNADRAAFDEWLRSLIPKTATLVRGRCVSVTDEKDFFRLRLSDGTEYTARRLVGADGASSLVRRTFFRGQKCRRLTAIQQSFPAHIAPFYACIFDRATTPAVSWILFKKDRLIYGGAFEPRDARRQFEAQKARLIARGILPSDASEDAPIEACEVLSPGFSGICTGNDRIFLIGEAAGFISPSSFEGIRYALLSAEALARTLAKPHPARAYRAATLRIRLLLLCKEIKRRLLMSPLRKMLLRSGILSVQPTSNEKENPSCYPSESKEPPRSR